jgi:hypothetical protein
MAPPLPQMAVPRRLPPVPEDFDMDKVPAPGERILKEPTFFGYKDNRVQTEVEEADDEERQRALRVWWAILGQMGESSGLWKTMPEESIAAGRSLAHALENKSTGTLTKRAAAIAQFTKWAAEQGVAPFPVTEEVAYAYVDDLGATRAPATRAVSFKEALGFAKGALGLVGAERALGSARFRGAVFSSFKRKRITVKAVVWKAAEVDKMEAIVCGAAGLGEEGTDLTSGLTLQEAVLVGFVLFTLHTRSRFGDSARIQAEPILDLRSSDTIGIDGFIEAHTVGGQVKAGQGPARARRALPVVGLAGGLSGRPWARAFIELRAKAGLHAEKDGTLLPNPLSGGGFGGGRLSTAAGGVWLKTVFSKAGFDVAGRGTHSAKATLLSWLAKAGVGMAARRLLGGHAKPGDRSALEYSRDALAGPLRELEKITTLVRMGQFNPDETRSGRWTTAAATASPAPPSSRGGLRVPDTPTRKERAVATQEAEAATSVSEEGSDQGNASSTSSSSSEAEAHAAVAEALENEEKETFPDIPREGAWLNTRTRTLHRASLGARALTACGRPLGMLQSELITEWPTAPAILCRRMQCFPFNS